MIKIHLYFGKLSKKNKEKFKKILLKRFIDEKIGAK